MTRQTSIQLSEETRRQIKELAKAWGYSGERVTTPVIERAIERAYQQMKDRKENQMNPRISYKKVAVLNDEQAAQMPHGYFDDNGGEPDGQLHIVPAEDAPQGARIENGFEIEYTGQYAQVLNHDRNFCGWSSRGVAYTADIEVAKAIAAEEEIAEA